MKENNSTSALILGIFIFLGLSSLGIIAGRAVIKYKQYERSVVVKGLSEKEYLADIVIWPIQFSVAENNLQKLYESIEENTQKIQTFLLGKSIDINEINFDSPSITDKSAQRYGNEQNPEFRYTAIQRVTVYSKNIDIVRRVMGQLPELGKEGIVFTGGDYQSQIEYIFTRLNEVKPEMIEEATRKAREVAEKFASDSESTLGKIKHASQGQFSIYARDNNNPHIKKVRVVSTVEYYLSD